MAVDMRSTESMFFESQQQEQQGKNVPFLSFDLLCEVLSRVDDGLTLARAACVSSEFRRVCEREEFWERRCNARWPSTTHLAARTLIAQTGGYRSFYAQCHLSLDTSEEDERGDDDDDDPSPSNFVSLVDVLYDGQPLLSRVVAGFPGAEEATSGWFEYCPFQFDLQEDGSSFINKALDRKLVWSALRENLTASWILVEKSSGRMANLATSRAVCGLRHWPCDDDFVLRFGTVLRRDVLCSVAVKAHAVAGEGVRVTEVGMRLENEDGARLYGMESVALLEGALHGARRRRTASHATAVTAYHGFRARQASRKAERIRRENRREVFAALVSGVGAVLCLCYILL